MKRLPKSKYEIAKNRRFTIYLLSPGVVMWWADSAPLPPRTFMTGSGLLDTGT